MWGMYRYITLYKAHSILQIGLDFGILNRVIGPASEGKLYCSVCGYPVQKHGHGS